MASSPRPLSIAGAKGKLVIEEPFWLASVWTKLKLIHPLTVVEAPAALFKSDIKPDVDVSQNISSKDSTGCVSKTPNNISYSEDKLFTCNDPIGLGKVEPTTEDTLPWDSLAM